MKPILLAFALFSTPFLQAQFTSAHLTAAGLTCAMCTKAIYNELEKIPFVHKVDTDIKNSAFMISFREGAQVDPDQLKDAVEDAGFSIANLKLTGNFSNVPVKNDAHVNLNGKTYHFLNVSPTSLDGLRTLTLVDKNYITSKAFRKYVASTEHPCIETGKAQECCSKTGITVSNRIYHVTL